MDDHAYRRLIADETLARLREQYVYLGFHPDRIKTLIFRDTLNVWESLSTLSAPKPRRERILAEIR